MLAPPMADSIATALRHGFADTGEVRLHYVEAGRGPLVVLLHGFPEFWWGWRRQIPALVGAGVRAAAAARGGREAWGRRGRWSSCPPAFPSSGGGGGGRSRRWSGPAFASPRRTCAATTCRTGR